MCELSCACLDDTRVGIGSVYLRKIRDVTIGTPDEDLVWSTSKPQIPR